MNATKQDLQGLEIKLNDHLTLMEEKIDSKLDSYAESIKDVAVELKENNKVLTRLIVEGEQYRALIKVVDDSKKDVAALAGRVQAVEIRQSGILEGVMRFGIPIACALFMSWTSIKGS